MLYHCMFSKSMKSSYPPAATVTHCVRVRATIVWMTLRSGISSVTDSALFSAFTTPWTIASTWSAADIFTFCYAPCEISATWTAAAAFELSAMIMYQIILKYVSYCDHLVTRIWLVFKWVRRKCYLEPCQLHWVISPYFSIPLYVVHLHLTCRFYMEPQATHRFILLAMSGAGYCKIYLDQKQ